MAALDDPRLRPGVRVAVGLSGGVDSSVAAWLLRRAGCEVVGLTMAIWDGSIPLPDEGRSGCFGPGEARDIAAAEAVAHCLGIAHHVVPLSGEYRDIVLRYFREEYLAGRTPNPCVVCNRRMKFGLLLERARAAGVAFDLFATGHYARVGWDAGRGRWMLRRGTDRRKDQSYFLSGLAQAQLAAVVAPLGAHTKDEVRALARAAGLSGAAAREESQDFVESRDYGVLFRAGEAAAGDMVDGAGRVVGRHRGIVHYTIGQRKGLGIGGAGEPYFVTGIDAGANRVIVGRRDELGGRWLTAEGCNWVARAAAPAQPERVTCQIRQRHAGAPAVMARYGADAVRVEFDEPQMSITPGQTAVFYDGDVVLGAGAIAAAGR